MKDSDKDLILELAYATGATRKLTGEQFLERIAESDGHTVGHRLLSDSISDQNADDVEGSMILLHEFGADHTDLDLLTSLLPASWHQSHDDVVSLMEQIADPRAIDPLAEIAQHPPAGMDPSDAHTLSNNAVWAISKIGGVLAHDALSKLKLEGCEATRYLAAQLAKREVGPNGIPSLEM